MILSSQRTELPWQTAREKSAGKRGALEQGDCDEKLESFLEHVDLRRNQFEHRVYGLLHGAHFVALQIGHVFWHDKFVQHVVDTFDVFRKIFVDLKMGGRLMAGDEPVLQHIGSRNAIGRILMQHALQQVAKVFILAWIIRPEELDGQGRPAHHPWAQECVLGEAIGLRLRCWI